SSGLSRCSREGPKLCNGDGSILVCVRPVELSGRAAGEFVETQLAVPVRILRAHATHPLRGVVGSWDWGAIDWSTARAGGRAGWPATAGPGRGARSRIVRLSARRPSRTTGTRATAVGTAPVRAAEAGEAWSKARSRTVPAPAAPAAGT